jgi:hypothetical protein
MKITLEHLKNAQSHAEKAHEAALLEAGKAIGQLELLKELEVLLAAPIPTADPPPLEPEEHDFILKVPEKS